MIKKLLFLFVFTTIGQLANAQQNIDKHYIEQHYPGWYILHDSNAEPECKEFEEGTRCLNRHIEELAQVIENMVAAAPTKKNLDWKARCEAKVNKHMKKVDDSPAKDLMRLAYTRDIYKEYLIDLVKKVH